MAALDKTMLGELIDLFSEVGMHSADGKSKDLLGRAYEYFISQFAGRKGGAAGSFSPPVPWCRPLSRCWSRTMAGFTIRAAVPAACSCSPNASSRATGPPSSDIAIYGQERNHTTWKLCKMNLAVRGIDADIKWNNEGSFTERRLPQLKFDYAMANPPFNISDWWQPQSGRAMSAGNLARRQRAMPTSPGSSISSTTLPRAARRAWCWPTAPCHRSNRAKATSAKRMIEGDVVDCMVALPGQLFYSTQIPACLWFLARDKSANGHRHRSGEFLFIDARNLGHMVDRTRREFSENDIATITGRLSPLAGQDGGYEDVPGFCKSVTKDIVEKFGYVLTPGRFVAAEALEDDGIEFSDRLQLMKQQLQDQQSEAMKLDKTINEMLGNVTND